MRQSISFTEPNADWLNQQVESKEYASKSEVVNDLIRHARARQNEMEFIRQRLIEAEQSGFIDKTPTEILAGFKEQAGRDGNL